MAGEGSCVYRPPRRAGTGDLAPPGTEGEGGVCGMRLGSGVPRVRGLAFVAGRPPFRGLRSPVKRSGGGGDTVCVCALVRSSCLALKPHVAFTSCLVIQGSAGRRQRVLVRVVLQQF